MVWFFDQSALTKISYLAVFVYIHIWVHSTFRVECWELIIFLQTTVTYVPLYSSNCVKCPPTHPKVPCY